MNNDYDTTMIPSKLFSLKNDEFFKFIKQLGSEMLFEILHIQLIDSTESLMKTNDIFDIFQYDSPEIDRLRNRIYFKTSNGDYILKSGIQANLRM